MRHSISIAWLFFASSVLAFDFQAHIENVVPMAGKPVSGATGIESKIFQATIYAKNRTADFGNSGATRGPKEISIFRSTSSGTVLIETDDGIGSGVVLTPEGHILTNDHVVGATKSVRVYFRPASGSDDVEKDATAVATVLKVDQVSDLALLKVSEIPASVRPIPLAEMAAIQVGADAHAIGHPRGQSWTYTRGYVSAIRRGYSWTSGENDPKFSADVIQTQTPINPGNSGGPLVNEEGFLIGINSFGDPKSPGLNFAVAVSSIEEFLQRNGNRVAINEKPKSMEKVRCGKQPVSERFVKSKKFGRMKQISFDPDCSGRVTMVLNIPDDERKAIYLTIEHPDKRGKTLAIAVDSDRDGQFDKTYLDLDGDGQIDRVGDNKPDELLASATRPYTR